MGLYDFTIYNLICRNALFFRNKEAWFEVDDNRTMTFSQYKEKVDRLAAGLQELGIEKGDRIGVLGKNSLGYFLLYGAAAALGAIILPINWRLSTEEIYYNLNNCKPVLVFADKEFQELIKVLRNKLLSVKEYFNLGQEGGNFSDFEFLINNEGHFEPPEIAINDGFVIIPTAAVAGRPRGALLSHNNILLANIHFAYILNLSPRDVHLNILPFSHVSGLSFAMAAFQAGVLNISMNKFDAAKAAELIEKKRVTFMFDFSPILSSILEQHEKTGADIKSLRAVVGLETPETIRKYQEVTGGYFYSVYGQTEVVPFTTFAPYNERPGSAGRVLPLAEVRLVDDNDRPVPVGHVGEITVRGPSVFKGYWNLPEDNEYIFRGGWHHTGDLGRFDEDGFLFYAGRKAEKDLIKPGGENVYPAEVERVIIQHPAIEKAVVFGVPDPKWKEAIKAVCQLKEGQRLDPQELHRFCGRAHSQIQEASICGVR